MSLLALVIYLGAVAALVVIVMLVSPFLGERHSRKAADEPFESGVVPIEYARLRLSAKFYLVAMFFVIFDLESVFIYAWAVAARDVGWSGYVEIVVFIAVLLAALAYLWKLGALDWAPAVRGRTPLPRSEAPRAPAVARPAGLAPGARAR